MQLVDSAPEGYGALRKGCTSAEYSAVRAAYAALGGRDIIDRLHGNVAGYAVAYYNTRGAPLDFSLLTPYTYLPIELNGDVQLGR